MTTTCPHGRSRPTYNTLAVSVGRKQERTQGPKAKACELAYNRNGRSPQDKSYTSPGQASHTASASMGKYWAARSLLRVRWWIIPHPMPCRQASRMRHFWMASKRWSHTLPAPNSQARSSFGGWRYTLLSKERLLYRNGVMGLSGCSLCGV
jgi:hypothetical protein